MGRSLGLARVLPSRHLLGVKNTWPDHAFLIEIDLNGDETDQQPEQAMPRNPTIRCAKNASAATPSTMGGNR